MTSLQEYDLEFKPETIVKGQGLCRLIADKKNDKDPNWENEAGMNLIDVCPIFTAPESWYRDLVYYLQQGYLLEHWNSKQRRALHLKSFSYKIMDGVLFKKKI